MTIAICDDEKNICEQVEKLVKKQMPDCNIELFASGEALLKEMKVFDIIFLDIQMDGINGIQTARMLRNKKEEALLIFITGLKEYVFESFAPCIAGQGSTGLAVLIWEQAHRPRRVP